MKLIPSRSNVQNFRMLVTWFSSIGNLLGEFCSKGDTTFLINKLGLIFSLFINKYYKKELHALSLRKSIKAALSKEGINNIGCPQLKLKAFIKSLHIIMWVWVWYTQNIVVMQMLIKQSETITTDFFKSFQNIALIEKPLLWEFELNTILALGIKYTTSTLIDHYGFFCGIYKSLIDIGLFGCMYVKNN